ASVHVTVPHAPAVVHSMLQCQLAGQVTELPVPVIVQVPLGKSHESHVGGHTAASMALASMAASNLAFGSTTQKPLSHTRPPLQSACAEHASLSVFVLTVQLHAAIATPATTATARPLT